APPRPVEARRGRASSPPGAQRRSRRRDRHRAAGRKPGRARVAGRTPPQLCRVSRREAPGMIRRILRASAPLLPVLLLRAAAHPAAAQTVTFDMGAPGGSSTGRIVQLLMLLTVLSLAPAILITVTSFTRIVVVLSFLRNALGTQSTPPNIVI